MRIFQNTLLRILYFIVRCFYRFLKVFLRPVAHRHPRIHGFAISVREAVKDLIRPVEDSPETKDRVISGPSVEVHHTIAEEREKVVMPEWLLQEWREIHAVEPQLYPGKWLVENIPFYLYDMPESKVGKHYLELCNLYGEKVSHVFLVPWLVRGGADLVTINYIRALTKQSLSQNIAVISTLDADSPWAERLPKRTRFIEFGKIYSHLSTDEQEKLLTRLLLQMAPQVIHNINSDLGYRIFVKYGKALSSFSHLYASSFCIDLAPDGKLDGYPVWYLPKCFDYLEAVLSENQAHLDRLHEIYAFDQGKMHVHYQPVDVPEQQIKHKNGAKKEHLDILWAGRLDRQKRPDILAGIARECLDLPFKFHVYGSPVMDTNMYYTDLFAKLDNVTYYGPYNELASLPTDRYDLFLYTSQWDGLPNVLLEAILLNLPIVASDVGGISELITDGETGFLIRPYDEIDRYVNCLKRIYNDRSIIHIIADKARALVMKRHSWDAFIENVKQVLCYIPENELSHPKLQKILSEESDKR